MNTFTEEETRDCKRVHEWMYKLDNGLINPIRELMDMEDKILDLEVRVKSLSDILAEKEIRGMKFDQNSMEAAKKVTELMGRPLGEIAMEILDLEAQVNSLSDILAEKDHKIIDLEASLAEYQREKHT